MRCLSMKTRNHRGQRSHESREFRKARSYCFEHSWYDAKLQERIFTGTEDELKAFVNIALECREDPENIPDAPQGLVLADNHCTGAFQ